MNEPKKNALSTDTDVERPSELVLHLQAPTSADPKEAERASRFFSGALKSAAAVSGLRRITLDLPDGVGSRSILEQFAGEAENLHFEACALVQFAQLEAWGQEAFSKCREVALHIDTGKFPDLKFSASLYDLVEELQAHNRLVTFQVLLSADLLKKLSLPRLRRWLDRTDFVTLVPPRLAGPDFDRASLIRFFEKLAPLWESADRFFHLHVDRSIKPSFFPWNLLSVTCPASDLALHLEADGGLFFCAAPQPFVTLRTPDELAARVEEHLERTGGRSDLCEGLPF